ncbi:uncharacterized protein FA14DRAFT_156760 [Meira miltonrushii]|uniref:Uncharacterized protein n=1 Tax=Meira miltonrushii TaxID=1280837 RepID=A0A316VDL5_9BASI|nr:uncharacterized protein FA14DRAFT_156760 [Meira miltonrushii]PWN34091.1 hypothetical protein FA14DRAFT_156760 [Meira miltonrushii]
MFSSKAALVVLSCLAFSATNASPLNKRVEGPAPCSQAGNGKFGTFSVSPSKNVVKGQPIQIKYQQNCAVEGDVYPSSLFVAINGEGNDPLQFVASLAIPPQEYGQPIVLDTVVPDGPLQFGNGSDLTISGTIQYKRKEVPDVTYLFEHQQPFSINEAASPYQGES